MHYAASPSNSSVWVIDMKGGGGCSDEKKCASRVNTDLGSSKGWSETFQGHVDLLSDDPKINPDFADANHVFIPYCSSDGHRGMRNATSKDTWGYYFSGHLNFAAVVGDLSAKRGLAAAKE
eukprot:gene8775-12814_t